MKKLLLEFSNRQKKNLSASEGETSGQAHLSELDEEKLLRAPASEGKL